MKNVVITILSILVIGLGGYLVYDKVLNKKESTPNNSTVDTSNVNVSAFDELEIINPDEISLLGGSYYYTQNSNIKLNNIKESDIFSIVRTRINSESIYNFEGHEEYQCDGPALRYKTDDILKQIETMFGKNKAQNFNFNSLVSNRIKYNSTNKTIDVLPSCGAFVTSYHVTNIDKIEIDKNEKVVLYETVEYYVDNSLDTKYTLKITYVRENGKYRFESAETTHLNNR